MRTKLFRNSQAQSRFQQLAARSLLMSTAVPVVLAGAHSPSASAVSLTTIDPTDLSPISTDEVEAPNQQGLHQLKTMDAEALFIADASIAPHSSSPEFVVATAQTAPQEAAPSSNNSVLFSVTLIALVVLSSILLLLLLKERKRKTMIEQMVNSISTFSQEIFSAVAEQERIASQQAASVHETTTTMDELEASCRQSVEQAQAAVTAAKQALQLTESGTQAVGKTLEGMFIMEKKVEAIAEQIVRLSEQANQIGGISQLVSDLANQTNMLALNSSVEAVRAGEHGKGFAVVANEIRKLSDQSQQSAEKISLLVSEIQKSINSTVMVTDEGTKTVKAGVQIAQKTEQSFTGVASAVNKVVLNNQQVSLNLKQQVDAIQQVVEAMENINKGSKETAAGLTQIRSGTKQLNEASVTLKETV
jgi:methyl-accepting chemotaxis protein